MANQKGEQSQVRFMILISQNRRKELERSLLIEEEKGLFTTAIRLKNAQMKTQMEVMTPQITVTVTLAMKKNVKKLEREE